MGNDWETEVWSLRGREKSCWSHPCLKESPSERKEKEKEGKMDSEIIATTVIQASASSNPTGRPGGVEGSDVSIAPPVAAFT